MSDLPEQTRKGNFAIKNWDELRKGGGKAPAPSEIKEYLNRKQGVRLTREELRQRIEQFFMDYTEAYVDENTGKVGYTWKSNPTKAALARYIGISAETLSRYARGEHDGMPYNAICPGNRGVVSPSDFDLIHSAYTLLQEFFEGRLALNANNAGVIFWLKNRDSIRWCDQQDLTISANSERDGGTQMSREEIAARYASYQEEPETLQLE